MPSIDGAEVNSLTWTGSDSDGTTKADNELGAAETQMGESSSTLSWLRSGVSPLSSSNSQPMFAMSETLIAVPEPATSCMALAGIACGGFSLWRRWKRA